MTDATTPADAASYDAPETSGGRSGRRGLVVAVVAALVVLLAAGGAVAGWRFLAAGGPRPADALPADTLGVVTIDLDPSGGQKLAAVRTLRQFPSFREQVGLEEDDDPVRAVFEALQEQEDLCPGLDYDDDVAPWLGQRFAVAALPGDDEPRPVVLMQVTDPEAARDGAAELAACATSGTGEGQGGYVVGDDFLVVAETEALAEQVVASAAQDPLADDETYRRWSDEVGDGIVEAYAAPGAAPLLTASAAARGGVPAAQLEDFEGAAAALRFADGGIVLDGALGLGAAGVVGGSVADHVATLPDDTAAVVALGSSTESRAEIRERLEAVEPGPTDDLLGLIEGTFASVGLSFPDDLLTVLGDSISISLGDQAPDTLASPTDLPLGVRVDGDADAVQDVLTRAEAGTGQLLAAQGLVVETGDDRVALSLQSDYAGRLVADGSLGDAEAFTDVVTDLEEAQAMLFVRLDGAWGDLLTASLPAGAQGAGDLEALRAFGLTARGDGDTTRFQARLSVG